jgi:hypothetical protein
MMTLKQRILHEFTPQVEQLMDIYARDWRLPSLTEDQAHDAVAYMHRLAANNTFKRIDANANKIKRTAGAQHSLAARLYEHDLIGEMTYCQLATTIIQKEPLLINNAEAARFMRKITSFRLFGFTMGYLASDHDPRYLSFVPPSQLDCLLTSASPRSRKIHTAVSQNLSNVEYVALHQIIKNAPSSWELYAKNEGIYTRYVIQDFGGGIRHKDKTPLTADELPEIFNEFSTKDSGHGLQIARHLIHSLGGHIEVITTTEKGTLRYSTQYEKASSSASFGMYGTLFSVYVPKDYLTTPTAAQSLPGQTSPDPHIFAPHPERELVS